MTRTRTATRREAYRRGLAAEGFAALGLRLRGWRILARRFKTPVGEIDLIARRGNVVAFIEVKARGDMAAALEAVTPQTRQRITRAAGYFIGRRGELAACALRFDVIAVAPPFYWRHLDNAWQSPT